MFTQATYADSHNAISSQALAFGHTLCETPDGQTTGKSGQGVVPVSRLAQQEKAKDLRIPVTCGRFGWN